MFAVLMQVFWRGSLQDFRAPEEGAGGDRQVKFPTNMLQPLPALVSLEQIQLYCILALFLNTVL